MLVLAGVLGFPLLFDTQPRPIAVDVPIEIPSRNQQAPAVVAEAAAPAPAAPKSSAVATADSLAAREELVDAKADAAPTPKPAEPVKAKSADPVVAKPAEKPVDKPAEKAVEKTAEKAAEKTPAKVPEKPVAEKTVEKAAEKPAEKPTEKATDKPAADNERIVVQVGAFAEVDRAREARLKLERAGLKTYTHVAETPQGRRIRVRMGPFATKAEAEKAAARAKTLGLPAALLWL